jgi:hypothetical protein
MDEAVSLSVGEQVCDKVWDEVGDEVGDEVSASPQACLLREKCRHFRVDQGRGLLRRIAAMPTSLSNVAAHDS